MDKYHPGYFGKVGMRHFHLKKNPLWRPVINLDKIWTLAGEGVREKYKNTEKVPVIDTLQHVRFYFVMREVITDLCQQGYAKVLAKGTISQPVIVRTRYVSALAEKKIKEAGGGKC